MRTIVGTSSFTNWPSDPACILSFSMRYQTPFSGKIGCEKQKLTLFLHCNWSTTSTTTDLPCIPNIILLNTNHESQSHGVGGHGTCFIPAHAHFHASTVPASKPVGGRWILVDQEVLNFRQGMIQGRFTGSILYWVDYKAKSSNYLKIYIH